MHEIGLLVWTLYEIGYTSNFYIAYLYSNYITLHTHGFDGSVLDTWICYDTHMWKLSFLGSGDPYVSWSLRPPSGTLSLGHINRRGDNTCPTISSTLLAGYTNRQRDTSFSATLQVPNYRVMSISQDGPNGPTDGLMYLSETQHMGCFAFKFDFDKSPTGVVLHSDLGTCRKPNMGCFAFSFSFW